VSAPSPPGRPATLATALVLAALIIAFLTAALGDSGAAVLLLDYRAKPLPGYPFPYPLTIQNLTHLVLALGLGELYLRWQAGRREAAFLGAGLLPEDYETVLQSQDLAPLRQRLDRARASAGPGALPDLIDLCILQFQASRSVDQTVSVLNSALGLLQERVHLNYGLLRYLAWVIPTLGFIGTVVGIALSLAGIDPASPDLARIIATLGTAFYTTLVALVESALLMLLLHLVQDREERAVNAAGRYVLGNLVNRLYSGRP
jgi:biopolymer transport protein ExbB/TolQ